MSTLKYDSYDMELGNKNTEPTSEERTLKNVLKSLENESERMNDLLIIGDKILFALENPYLNWGDQSQKIDGSPKVVENKKNLVDLFYDVSNDNHNKINAVKDYLIKILEMIDR